MKKWFFYIIVKDRATYAGVSPDPERRLRQHNGIIKGGAKYPLSRGSGWEHACIISGFPSKINAMQFEWAVKHCAPIKKGGVESRFQKIKRVMDRERWTSKSPLSSEITLNVDIKPKFHQYWHLIVHAHPESGCPPELPTDQESTCANVSASHRVNR